MTTTTHPDLTPEQIEALGHELDELRNRVRADLGERDAAYIRRVVTACPGDQWRHSHNYMHHTHTNVLGKARDIGYGILRMSEDQP
jgi:fatty acid desaturase